MHVCLRMSVCFLSASCLPICIPAQRLFLFICPSVCKPVSKWSLLILITIPLSFQRALQVARDSGIPFIYVSANSGARLGLAEELKLQFKVAWEDPAAPQKVSSFLNSDCKNLQTTSGQHVPIQQN